MGTNWKKAPLTSYSIHKTIEADGGYNYFAYVHPLGQVIIMRETVDNTEILYADGGFSLTIAWTGRAGLEYKQLSKI